MVKSTGLGNFLVVQWLELHAFIAKGLGSIPGWNYYFVMFLLHVFKHFIS